MQVETLSRYVSGFYKFGLEPERAGARDEEGRETEKKQELEKI